MAPVVPGRRGRTGTVLVVVAYVALAVAAGFDAGSLVDRVDAPVERFVTDHRPAWSEDVAAAVTHLGDTSVGLVLGVVLAVVAWGRSRRVAATVLVVTVSFPIVQGALKAAVDRDRPDLAALVRTSSSSFPSGHAMTAAAMWTLVPIVWSVWAGATSGSPSLRRRTVTAGAAVVIVAVAASRVWLGVHWTSDVVGGVLAGVALVGVADALVVSVARGTDAASRPPC